MDENRLRYLYDRFNRRTASDAEVNEFYNALSDPDFDRVVKAIMDSTWDSMTPLHIKAVPEEISVKIYGTISERQSSVQKIRSMWPRIAMAAAMATIIFGVWFFAGKSGRPVQEGNTLVRSLPISPGKNTAVLTFSNGKTVQLSDKKSGVVVGINQLTYDDHTQVATGIEGSGLTTLTASTPRGGTYQVTLPDGTKVWLNADSKISFPSKFDTDERKVLLDGEAYFEVARLTRSELSDGVRIKHRVPFIVTSKTQLVEVLGTHFNINSYTDEASVKTTLLEGSVKVNGTLLVPNQQAVLTGTKLQVKNINAAKAIAWKNGKFVFEQENLESIMRKLARWYNVEVRFDGDFSQATFTGSISRYENIASILEKITFTEAVRFKIEGRRVTVMP